MRFNDNEIAIVGPVTTDPTDRRSHFRGVLVLGSTDYPKSGTQYDVEECLTGLRYPVSAKDLHSVESWERGGRPALATLNHKYSTPDDDRRDYASK